MAGVGCLSPDILVEREKIIGQYICGIYVESLPHHLLNKFFLLLKGQEPGQQISGEKTIVLEMSYAARDALGGAGWDVSSLQSETLVMQNRIIIQMNPKPKLLVEGRIMWMDRK